MQVNLSLIKIKPDRQRKNLGDLSELKASLAQVGLINPIVVEPAEEPGYFYLLAGERRFTAWKEGHAEGLLPDFIEARLMSELDEPTRQLIELEENVKRKDLTWQEQVLAVAKLYKLKNFETALQAAPYFGIDNTYLSRMLQVANSFSNEKVANAPTFSSAYSIVTRDNARAIDSMSMELNSFFKGITNEPEIKEPTYQGTTSSVEQSTPVVESKPEEPAEPKSHPWKIIQGNFLEWVQNYKGKPFDLLHLDFPYGIDHDRSQQGNTASYGTYEDSEDVYKNLITGFLENQDKFIADKAHCICWLSLRYLEWTKEIFAKNGWSCHMQPLIWHKSDNKGIIADTQCGFRNVCEYALFFNKGRKKVVKNISNLIANPTTKRFHASEKPLPVLKYFFSGLCDNYSRVLDPTCGSGTAIMAAEWFNAEEALGIELDPDFATKANEWLELERSRKDEVNIQLDLEDLL